MCIQEDRLHNPCGLLSDLWRPNMKTLLWFNLFCLVSSPKPNIKLNPNGGKDISANWLPVSSGDELEET